MQENGSPIFDIAIVGAGPVGSTCAYYLANQGYRVALLEKSEFPRDKLCGDAICTRAQHHLRRMGVLQEIIAERSGHWAEVGGMVSPSGIEYIDNSATHTHGSLVIAIKRKILDAKVAHAAQEAGAYLRENYAVAGVEFSHNDKRWTVRPRGTAQPPIHARMLVACDGASSSVARSLGVVQGAPEAVCSRAYVKAATSDFKADGVVFYPQNLLPGYCAIFREAGGELNFCCYILPGGSCKSADLRVMHERILQSDPHVRKALGPNAELETMRGAGLRLGGVAKSYADHLLVVGDAAGHIDPLTGEGIQYGMDAAELAAKTIDEAFRAGRFDAGFLRRYHSRWMQSFGWDFAWSRRMARMSGKFPIFVDACAEVTRRKGPSFLAQWGEVMTGAKPKSAFLQPRIVLPIVFEAGRQWLRRMFQSTDVEPVHER